MMEQRDPLTPERAFLTVSWNSVERKQGLEVGVPVVVLVKSLMTRRRIVMRVLRVVTVIDDLERALLTDWCWERRPSSSHASICSPATLRKL